jgi:branched-chain amino acid transport system substrate-binding protein
MRTSRVAVAMVMLVMAATLAACGSSSKSSSGGSSASSTAASASSGSSGSTSASSSSSGGSPVTILAIVDTTGPIKAFGAQELAGIQAAAAYYNANGGIDGHHVNVQAVSDNGDPSTAASVAIKTISPDPSKYTMVYAGEEGTTVAALVPILKRFPVYSVALDDPNDVCAKASNCPNEFANLGSGAVAEIPAADWFKAHHYTHVGLLQDESAYTQTETPAILSALAKDHITVTKVSFPATAVDLSSEMSQLKSAGVQAVYAEALGPAAGYTLKARAAVGLNAPVVFDVAGSALDLTTLAPTADVKNSYTTICGCQDPAKKSPGYTQLRKYAAKGVIGPLPGNLAGDGWDAVVLFNHALTQAGSTSASALTKATENLNASGQSDPMYIVTAKKRFTAANHQNLDESPSDYSILAAGPVKNGQTQPLK